MLENNNCAAAKIIFLPDNFFYSYYRTFILRFQMQKFIIIIFTLILAYMNVGYYAQVSVQKELAQEEMKERILKIIPDSSLILFELGTNKNKMTWKEEGEEFWLNNALYDVVKTLTVNGKTYIYCINDAHEEKVIEDYRINIGKKSSSGNGQKIVASFFAPVFINTAIPRVCGIEIWCKKEFCLYQDDILQQDKKIISPPPKA